jgi:hypothetical protein
LTTGLKRLRDYLSVLQLACFVLELESYKAGPAETDDPLEPIAAVAAGRGERARVGRPTSNTSGLVTEAPNAIGFRPAGASLMERSPCLRQPTASSQVLGSDTGAFAGGASERGTILEFRTSGVSPAHSPKPVKYGALEQGSNRPG